MHVPCVHVEIQSIETSQIVANTGYDADKSSK